MIRERPDTGASEELHGIMVSDPFRWLEDRCSNETSDWISHHQSQLTTYLSRLGSMDVLRTLVQDHFETEVIDAIGAVNNRYFFRKRRKTEEQPSVMVMERESGCERSLVRGTDLGPNVTADILAVSANSDYLAYSVRQGGEHPTAIQIVNVNTGRTLPDHLPRGLASGFVFQRGNAGFYYCHESLTRGPSQAPHHVVQWHRYGSPGDEDVVLLKVPRSDASSLVLHSDGSMLGAVLCRQKAKSNLVDFYFASQDNHGWWECRHRNIEAPFIPMFYRGRLFAYRGGKTGSGELVELSVSESSFARIVVPECAHRLRTWTFVGSQIYVSYVIGTTTAVQIWSLDARFQGNLSLEEGFSWYLLRPYSAETNELFLHREALSDPPTLFRCALPGHELSVWARRRVPAHKTPINVRRTTYSSKDGTDIAISLIGHKDDLTCSDRPVIMTGYGGFGIALTPQYSVFASIMLELGFLLALPEIRGGAERGQQWYEAARGRNRQVSFDDFIAAAEWLCETRVTNPDKLAVFGGSNAGLLVGAAITQRPDLFRACLCIAPLLDMVRYHLFDRAESWAKEYGTAEDPIDFRVLLAYSPYHNVCEEKNYPAVLFVTGDQDTRCNPAHVRKMVARLEHRTAQQHPVLVDYNNARGHSPTLPLSVRVEALLIRIAFLCNELEVPISSEG